jgi:DNA-binding XRE family transcriptional regulator
MLIGVSIGIERGRAESVDSSGRTLGQNPATTTAAVEFATCHCGPPFLKFRDDLYYSLWNYSTDHRHTRLGMQARREVKRSNSAELCFGQVLREQRKKMGLTQEELAFQSAYHPTYIGQLERGAKSPSLRTILGLALVLGVSASELIQRVETLLLADGESPNEAVSL